MNFFLSHLKIDRVETQIKFINVDNRVKPLSFIFNIKLNSEYSIIFIENKHHYSFKNVVKDK
ncbi:hypothetical protein BpHYR1_046346 [Brachionus plicatilis]|uniref:Uncharacterized protein n=1 Tax=Brachionus plicatilis TaxID=10195 RepID=A0A3M7PHE3_BRAPC|nr:hypothetical protein BpHYR1_046346 [Brachionus plicatilis]